MRDDDIDVVTEVASRALKPQLLKIFTVEIGGRVKVGRSSRLRCFRTNILQWSIKDAIKALNESGDNLK
jgi:hypothetical protein